MAAPHPARLGPCKLIRQIGAGGMGTVYLGEMLEDKERAPRGSRVAVKVVHPERLGFDSAEARFRQEAVLGSRVNHPCVVRTHAFDVEVIDGLAHYYMLMELVEGRTLRQVFAELGQVAEPLLRHVGGQVARGLSAVHAVGALHRDVKPENVIITPDQVVKVMDLGVARHEASAIVPTTVGVFLGTLAYASPEHVRGDPMGPPSDLYALGALLYEGATRSRPLEATDLGEIVRLHLRVVPKPASTLNPDVSPFFDALLACLLEKEPTARFASATELAETLEQGESSAWWRVREAEDSAATRGRRRPRIAVHRATNLIGRRPVLEALAERFDAARRGEGGLVLLEGEAGIGKSRVLAEFLSEIDKDADDVSILHGAYSPGRPGGSQDAFARALVAHVGPGRLQRVVRRHVTRTPALVDAFVASLLGETPPPGSSPLAADSLPTLHEQVARGLAAEGPLAWIVEDIHFADESGREILDALALAAASCRMLVVATTRPGLAVEHLAALERLPSFTRRRLERLTDAQVSELLAGAVGSPSLAKRLAPRIAAKSDGNPLFVLALVDELRARGALGALKEASQIVSQRVDDLPVPSSISDLLRERLGALSDADRGLLEAAAVQGHEVDPDLVARGLGRDRLDVLQVLAGIERRTGLIRAKGAAFAFDHHLLQELLYDQQPEALRAEYHGRLARGFEARLEERGARAAGERRESAAFLAGHHLRGPEPERGVPYLLPALDLLAKRGQVGALLDLASLAQRALARDDPFSPPEDLRRSRAATALLASDAASWHAHLGDAHYGHGEFALAEQHLQQALHLLGFQAGSAGLAGKLRVTRQVAAQALHVLLPRVLFRAPSGARPRLRAASRAASRLATIAPYRNDMALTVGASLLSVNLAERAGDVSVFSLGILGFAAAGLRLRRLARRYLEEGVQAGRNQDRHRDLVHALKFDGVDLYDLGRLDESARRIEECHDLARSLGYALGVTESRGMLAVLGIARGRLEATVEDCADLLESVEASAPGAHRFFPHFWQAFALLSLRREREAAEVLARSREHVDDRDALTTGMLLGLEALLAARNGSLPEALAAAAKADGRLAGGERSVPSACFGGLEAGVEAWLVCWERGQVDLPEREPSTTTFARAAVKRLQSWASYHPVRRPSVLVLAARACLLDRDHDGARALASEATLLAERMGLVLDRSRAEAVLARCHAEGTDERQAHLARARALETDMGIAASTSVTRVIPARRNEA